MSTPSRQATPCTGSRTGFWHQVSSSQAQVLQHSWSRFLGKLPASRVVGKTRDPISTAEPEALTDPLPPPPLPPPHLCWASCPRLGGGGWGVSPIPIPGVWGPGSHALLPLRSQHVPFTAQTGHGAPRTASMGQLSDRRALPALVTVQHP